MLPDIQNREDISRLVGAFYARAFKDPIIGYIFTDVARIDLDEHLPVFTDFWETVLFRAGTYKRNALQVHFALNAKVPLEAEMFDRWLGIWTSNVDDHFSGEVADRAKLQATRIAGSMHRRVRGRSSSEFETIGRREALVESGMPTASEAPRP